MVKDFRDFIRLLEADGELIRVQESLSTEFEIAAAVSMVRRKQNKAIFFEKVQGYQSSMIANVMGSKRRFAMALGVSEQEVEKTYLRRKHDLIKPQIREDEGSDFVEIERNIDILGAIPVLTHYERDAGPYFTAAITIAKDPKTGLRGMGIHRIQVKDKDKLGIFLSSPPLSNFLKNADDAGQPLEIAIINGIHPLILMASVMRVPSGTDKFDVAGGLLQRPVDLVKCKSMNLEVPSGAEFILEGEVIPRQRETEGPFGESSGFYLTYDNPVAKIRAIRYRKDPVYQALLAFGGEDFAMTNLLWGLEHMQDLKNRFPFVRDVVFEGINFMAIVQVDNTDESQLHDIAEHLFHDPHTKIIICVDKDVDIHSHSEVMWAVCTRMRAPDDLHFKKDLPGLIIDPLVAGSKAENMRITKLLIDATIPPGAGTQLEKVDLPASVKSRVEAMLAKQDLI